MARIHNLTALNDILASLYLKTNDKRGKNQLHFKEKSMDFLAQLLRGIAFVPALVNGIEGLFGNKSGAEKKDAAMSFLQTRAGHGRCRGGAGDHRSGKI